MGWYHYACHPALCCFLCCCCSVGHVAFVFIVGDDTGDGPLDSVYRFLFIQLPGHCRRVGRCVCGPKFDVYRNSVHHYLFNTNNCIAQVFYLCLTVGGYTGFIVTGYPLFPTPYLPDSTPWVSLALMVLCLVMFVAVSVSDPGTITKENAAVLATIYEYDNVIFKEGQMCPTCRIPKVARSKHCRLCDRCVMKFDHHCIWVSNCVGFYNIRLFLLFLFIHTVMTVYGSIALFLLLKGIVVRKGLWTAYFFEEETREKIEPSWFVIVRYLVGQHSLIVYLWVCCTAFSIILLGFTSWHLYLALIACATTNEHYKRSISQADDDVNVRMNPRFYVRHGTEKLIELFLPRRWLRQKPATQKQD